MGADLATGRPCRACQSDQHPGPWDARCPKFEADLVEAHRQAVAPAPVQWIGNHVPGVGPVPARVALVGEAPGEEEDQAGEPFVGPSGAVLDAALMRYGLPRHTVYITNLYKRRPSLDNDDPTPEQQAEGLAELLPELERVGPEIVVCVGRLAAKALMGAAFESMDTNHGVPVRLTRVTDVDHEQRVVTFDTHRIYLPLVHPAAGMHQPFMMDRFDSDMRTLGKLAGGWRPEPPAEPELRYSIAGPGAKFWLTDGAVDTEGVPGAEYCASWSYGPGDGLVMRARDIRAGGLVIGGSGGALEARIRMHHALWDLPILEAMGAPCPPEQVLDTMILAYVLQDEPQGLKELAYKHLGEMRAGYEDVVDPHYLRALEGWWRRVCGKFADAADLHVQTERLAWEALNKDPKTGKVKRWTKTLETASRKLWAEVVPRQADLLKRLQRTVKDLDAGRGVDLKARFKAIPEELLTVPYEKPPAYTLDVVPEAEMVGYAAADADDTLRVSHILERRVKEEGLEGIAQMDHAVLPMLHRWNQVGLPIDIDYARQLSVELEVEQVIAYSELAQMAGDYFGVQGFNPGSGDQVAGVLQALMREARTDTRRLRETPSKTRISTDDRALEDILRRARVGLGGSDAGLRLRGFVDKLRAYRGNSKLKSTFVDPIIEKVQGSADGRLHFKTKYTRIYTGRIAYEDPNVGAMPRDPRIRALISAGPGRKIVAADLSQIEPRMMAHLSRDPELVRIYREGRDLYSETAAQITGRPIAEVGKGTEIRQAFKVIDLSLIYLISAPSLYENLLWDGIESYTLDQVVDIRREWFALLSGIMPYYGRIWDEARQRGYVQDMWGRRRWLANLRLHEDVGRERAFWVNKKLASMRAEAERQAGNHTIQGGAQGIMKRAMIRIWNEVVKFCWQHGVYCEPLLQVHDELLLEVQEDWAEVVALKVEECMQRDSEWFEVPLIAEYGIGPNWAKAKK